MFDFNSVRADCPQPIPVNQWLLPFGPPLGLARCAFFSRMYWTHAARKNSEHKFKFMYTQKFNLLFFVLLWAIYKNFMCNFQLKIGMKLSVAFELNKLWILIGSKLCVSHDWARFDSEPNRKMANEIFLSRLLLLQGIQARLYVRNRKGIAMWSEYICVLKE